jgi:hypothetical protein
VPWTAPAAIDLKTRYPEFASVADSTVNAVLEEAVGEVGDTWIEKDRTPAVLALTAHLLSQSGMPGAPGAGGGRAAVAGAIKRRKVGDVETEFAGIGDSRSTSPLARYRTTAYGLRYLELMRRNFPTARVV